MSQKSTPPEFFNVCLYVFTAFSASMPTDVLVSQEEGLKESRTRVAAPFPSTRPEGRALQRAF